MLIKFVEETTVQDKTKRHYPKGCVVEMAADACRHFVSRKKAVFIDAKPAPVVKAPVSDAVEEVAEAVAKKSRKRRK